MRDKETSKSNKNEDTPGEGNTEMSNSSCSKATTLVENASGKADKVVVATYVFNEEDECADNKSEESRQKNDIDHLLSIVHLRDEASASLLQSTEATNNLQNVQKSVDFQTDHIPASTASVSTPPNTSKTAELSISIDCDELPYKNLYTNLHKQQTSKPASKPAISVKYFSPILPSQTLQNETLLLSINSSETEQRSKNLQSDNVAGPQTRRRSPSVEHVDGVARVPSPRGSVEDLISVPEIRACSPAPSSVTTASTLRAARSASGRRVECSRHIRRPPKEPEEYVEALFPHIQIAHNQIRQALLHAPHTDVKDNALLKRKMIEVIQLYTNGCKSEFERAVTSLVLSRRLKRNIMRLLDLFYDICLTCREDHAYLHYISQLIGVYNSLEIRLSFSMTRLQKCALIHRISHLINKHLMVKDESLAKENILRMFLHMPDLYSARFIMEPLFNTFLQEIPTSSNTWCQKELPDKTFVQYIVILHLWKEMLRDPLEQVELINRAQHYMCPTKTLHANPMYANHLPTIHTRKHAVKDILNSLKFFHDLRNAAICDDTLHDGDDEIEVVIDEVINTPCWDFGATYKSETKQQRHIKNRVTATEPAEYVDLTIDDDEDVDMEPLGNSLPWLTKFKENAAERVSYDESEKVICLDSDSEGELFSGSILDPAESYQDCDAFDTDYTSLDSSASDDRVPSDEEILPTTAISNNGLRTYLTPKSKKQVTSYEDKRTATCQRSYERVRDGDGEGDCGTVGAKSTATTIVTETGLPLIVNTFTVRGKQNMHLFNSPRQSLDIGPERFGNEYLDDTCNEGRGSSRNVIQKHDRAKSAKTNISCNIEGHSGGGGSRDCIASHEKGLNRDTDEDDEDEYHSFPSTASSSATTLGKVIYSQAISPSKHRFSGATAEHLNEESRKHFHAEEKPVKKQVKFNDNPIGPTRRPHTKLPIKPAIHLTKIQPNNQPRVFSNSPQPRFASPSSSTSSTAESLKQMAQKGRSFVVKSKLQESKNLLKTSSSIIIDTDDDDNDEDDDITLVNASINIRKNPLKLSTQPIQSKKAHKKGITNQQLSICNSNICTNTRSVSNRTINLLHGPKDISSTNNLRDKSVDIMHRADDDDDDDDNNENDVDKEVEGEAHVSNVSTIRNNVEILEVEKRVEMEEQNSNVSTTTGPNIDSTVDVESLVDRPVAVVSDRCTFTVESTSTEEYESIATPETLNSIDICTSSTGANMQDLLKFRKVSENNAELSNTPVLFSVPLNIKHVNRRDDIYIAIADQQKGDEAESNACIEFVSDLCTENKIISADKNNLNATCNVDKPTGIESVFDSKDANKDEQILEENTNESEKTESIKEGEIADNGPLIIVTQKETVLAVNQEIVEEIEQKSADAPKETQSTLEKINKKNYENQGESQEASFEMEETAGKSCNDLDGIEIGFTSVKEKSLTNPKISAIEESKGSEKNTEVSSNMSLEETVKHNHAASDNIEVQSSEKAIYNAEIKASNVEKRISSSAPNKEITILAESNISQEENLKSLEISANTEDTNQNALHNIKEIQVNKEESKSGTEINFIERNFENVNIENTLAAMGSVGTQEESTDAHTAEVNRETTASACDSIVKNQPVMSEASIPLPEISANQEKSIDSKTNIEPQFNATESPLEIKYDNLAVRKEIPNVQEENIKTEKVLDTNTDEIKNNGNDYKPIEVIDSSKETTTNTSAALVDNMTAHKEIFNGGTTNTTNDGLVCLVAAVKAVEALTSNTFSSENVEDKEMESVSSLKVHEDNEKSENGTDSTLVHVDSVETNRESSEKAPDVAEKRNKEPMARIQVMTVVAAKTSSAVMPRNIYFSGDKSPQTNLERLAEAVLLSEAAAKKNSRVVKEASVSDSVKLAVESVDMPTKNASKNLNIALVKPGVEKINTVSGENVNASSVSNLNKSVVPETTELAVTELTCLKVTAPTLDVESSNVETCTLESLPTNLSSDSQISVQQHVKITQVLPSIDYDKHNVKVGDYIKNKKPGNVENSGPLAKDAVASTVKAVNAKNSMSTRALINKNDESFIQGSQETLCVKSDLISAPNLIMKSELRINTMKSELSSIVVQPKTGSTFLSSFENFISTLKDPPPNKAQLRATRRSPRTLKVVGTTKFGKKIVCDQTPDNKKTDSKSKQTVQFTPPKEPNINSTTPKNFTSATLQTPEISVSSESKLSSFGADEMQVRKRYSLRKSEQWKVVKNTGLRTFPPTNSGESLTAKKSATNVRTKRCIKIRLARAKVPTKAEKKEFLPLPKATTVDIVETQFGDMSHRPITRRLAAALNSSLQMETEDAVIEPIKPFIEGARKCKPKLYMNRQMEETMTHKRRKCMNMADTLSEKSATESNTVGGQMLRREKMNAVVKGKRKHIAAETTTEMCKEPIKNTEKFEEEHNCERVEPFPEDSPSFSAKSSAKRTKIDIPKKMVTGSEKVETSTVETVFRKPDATKISSMKNTKVPPKRNNDKLHDSLPTADYIPRESTPSLECKKLKDSEQERFRIKKEHLIRGEVTASVVNEENSSTMEKLCVKDSTQNSQASAEMYDAFTAEGIMPKECLASDKENKIAGNIECTKIKDPEPTTNKEHFTSDEVTTSVVNNEHLSMTEKLDMVEMSIIMDENYEAKKNSNNALHSAEIESGGKCYDQISESSLEALRVEIGSGETGSTGTEVQTDIIREKICCEKSVDIHESVIRTPHNVTLLNESTATEVRRTDSRSTESEKIASVNFHENSNSLPDSNNPSRLVDISSFSSLTLKLDESYNTTKSVIKFSTKPTTDPRYDIEFIEEDSNINMSISHIEIKDKNEEPNDIVSINTLKANMEADKLLEEYNHSTRIIANANLRIPAAVQTPTDGRTPACSSVSFSYTGSDSSSSFTNSCSCSTTSTVNSATDLYKNEPTSFKVVQSQAQVVELLSSTNTSFQDLSLLDLEHDVIINHDELLSELMPSTVMEHNYATKPLEIPASNEYDTQFQEKEEAWPCRVDEGSDNKSSIGAEKIVATPTKKIPSEITSLKVSIPIAYIKRLEAITGTDNASKNWYLSEKPSTSKAALAALAKRNAQLGIDTMFTETPRHARKRNVIFTDHTESRQLHVRDPSPSLPLKKRRNISGAPDEDLCNAAVILFDECDLVNNDKNPVKENKMNEAKFNISENNRTEDVGFQNAKYDGQNTNMEQELPKRISEHLNETVCNVESELDGEKSEIIVDSGNNEENNLSDLIFQSNISVEKKLETVTSNINESSLGRKFGKEKADENTVGAYLFQQALVDYQDNGIGEQNFKTEAAVSEEISNGPEVEKALEEQRNENSDENEPSRKHQYQMDINVPENRTVENDFEFNEPAEISDTTERQIIQPQQHERESDEFQTDAENLREMKSPVNTIENPEATSNFLEVIQTVQDQNINPMPELEANVSENNRVTKEIKSVKQYVIGETFVETNEEDEMEMNVGNIEQEKESTENIITVLEIPKSLAKYFETPDEEISEEDQNNPHMEDTTRNLAECMTQCEENEIVTAQESNSNEETQPQYTLNMCTNGINNEVIIKITKGKSEKKMPTKSKLNVDNSSRDLLQKGQVNLTMNELEKEAAALGNEAAAVQGQATTEHQSFEVLQNSQPNITTNKTENERNFNKIQGEVAQNSEEHAANNDIINSSLLPQAQQEQATEMTTVQQLLVPDHRGLTLSEASYTDQANDDATANCADNTQAQHIENYISIQQNRSNQNELLNFDDQANETILTNYEDQFFVPGCLNDSVSGFTDATNNMFPSNVYAENDFDIANNIIIRTQEIKEESMEYMSNINSPKNSPINLTTSVAGFSNATDLAADLLKSNEFIDLTTNLTNNAASSNSIDYQLFTIGSDIRTSFPSGHITTMPTSTQNTLCATLPHSQTSSANLNVHDTPTLPNYGFDVEQHGVSHSTNQDLTQLADLGFVVETMQTSTEDQLPATAMQTVQVQDYTNFAQTPNHVLTPEQKGDTTTTFVGMTSPTRVNSSVAKKTVPPFEVVPMADAHEAQSMAASAIKICSTSQPAQPTSKENEHTFGMERNLTTTTEMTTYVPQHLTQPATLSPILPLIKPSTTTALSSSNNENTNEVFSFNNLETSTTQITHMRECTMVPLSRHPGLTENFTTTTTATIADNGTIAGVTTSSTNTESGEENSTTSLKAQSSNTQTAELLRGMATTRTRAPARVQIVAPQRKSHDFPPKTSEEPKTPEAIFTNTTAAFCTAIEYNTNQVAASLPHTYPATSPTQCSNNYRFEKYIKQLATFMDVSGIIASTQQHVCVDKKDWAAAHLALFTQASPLASVLLIKQHDDGTMSIYFDSDESIVLTAEMVKLVNRLSLALIILQKRQTPVLSIRDLLKTVYKTMVSSNTKLMAGNTRDMVEMHTLTALEHYGDSGCGSVSTIGNKQQLQQMQPLINSNFHNLQMYTGNWNIAEGENTLKIIPSNHPTIRIENEQQQQQLSSADTLPLQVEGAFANYEQPIAFAFDDNTTTILTTNAMLHAQPYEQAAFHAVLADSEGEKNYNWTEAEQIGLLNWQQEASPSTELNQHQAHSSSACTSLFNEQTTNSNIEHSASDYVVANNEELHTVFTVNDVTNDKSTTEPLNITDNMTQTHHVFNDKTTMPKGARRKRATIKKTPIKKSIEAPKFKKVMGKSLEKSTSKQRINKPAPISAAVKPQQHMEETIEPTSMQHHNPPSTTPRGSATIHYRHNAPPQVGSMPNQHTATMHYKQPVAGVPSQQGIPQTQQTQHQQQQSLYNSIPQTSTPFNTSAATNQLIQTIPLINIENLKNIQLLSQQSMQNSALYAAGQGNTVRYLITTPHTPTATLQSNKTAPDSPAQIPHIAYSYQLPQHYGDNYNQSHTNNTNPHLQTNAVTERVIGTDTVITTTAPPTDASLLRKVRSSRQVARSADAASKLTPKATPNNDSVTNSDGVLITEIPALTPALAMQQQFLQTSQTDVMSNNRVEHFRNSQNLIQSAQQQQQGPTNIRAEEDERMYTTITRISTPTQCPPEEHTQQHEVNQELQQLPILTVTTQRQSILAQQKRSPGPGKKVKTNEKPLTPTPTTFVSMPKKSPNPTRKRGRPRKYLAEDDVGNSNLIKMRSAYETAQKFARLRESVKICSVTRVPTPPPPPPQQQENQQHQQENAQQLRQQQHHQHQQLRTSSFTSSEHAFNMPEHMFSIVDGQNVVLAGDQQDQQQQQQDLQPHSHSHSHMPSSPTINQQPACNV